jgi:hypothetical protein
MANADDNAGIKITLEELGGAVSPAPAAESASAPGPAAAAVRKYGNVSDAADPVQTTSDARGSLLLRAWFYLGLAGLVGSLLGWAICEPSLVDGDDYSWGDFLLIPLCIALPCVGFGVAESIAERSFRKGVYRAALAIPLGSILGFMFGFGAGLLFNIGLAVVALNLGVTGPQSPLFWIVRALAWAVFGIAGGVVYGIIGSSMQKALYGMLGGALGAGLGGLLFDPVANFVDGGELSRMIGFSILGAATGVSMGIVESALKQRWLYVAAGPLAGKQFILYKDRTVLGSDQQCDIYLFKDAQIAPRHAFIEKRGNRLQLTATGPVYVSGQPVRGVRVLQDGDLIQVGRYGFRFREKRKS